MLGRDVTTNLVSSFVLSRLDYGNALLAGLSYTTIALLQRVISAAVRLVYGLRPHVSATAIELHWLPVEAHIQLIIIIIVKFVKRHTRSYRGASGGLSQAA